MVILYLLFWSSTKGFPKLASSYLHLPFWPILVHPICPTHAEEHKCSSFIRNGNSPVPADSHPWTDPPRSPKPTWAEEDRRSKNNRFSLRVAGRHDVTFPGPARRIFVVSERNELCVSQVIGPGPLQKLDAGNWLRTHPNTLLDFLRGEPLTPSARGQFGKVDERAFRRLWTLESLERLTSRRSLSARAPRQRGSRSAAALRFTFPA